ncbi:neutral zinc metallopeptidase [Nocardia sp. alder85J]|uniref:neutral zinc metallopeptidase n=1 Tax=Nocardia sp. alder85J TaxID=2862949 RepID=UPI001CD6A886|nr:neutral zinc metallopeptidase [Nocardia sp. alder85J]MCX4093749.1 neutral zinc metallopeptidase [Nocardia sp. alder85J]
MPPAGRPAPYGAPPSGYGPPPGYRYPPGQQPYPQGQQPYPGRSPYPAAQQYAAPQPYGPPGRPPQRKRGGGGIATVLVVLVLVVAGLVVRGALSASKPGGHIDSGARYTYTSEAPPAPGNGKDSGTAGVAATGTNPLLADPGSPLSPAHCDYAPWGTQVDVARKFFTSAAACLEQAWRPVLAAAKLPFTPPKLNVTATTAGITTPCTGSSSNFAAFYCSADQTIYMPISQLQTDMFQNHWEVYLSVFAHEYGHHVQAQSGIMAAANKQRRDAGVNSPGGLEVSRRIELGANCFDGMFLAATSGGGSLTAAQTTITRKDAYGRGDAPGDMRDHGTSQHMGDWWSAGFDDDRTAQCNTFTAAATDVS